MPPALSQYWSKIARFWSDRTLAQRILVGGLAASVILAFLFMLYFLNQVEYKVLYSRLSQEDASRVVEQLQAAKAPYQIKDNGTTIMVPEDMVYEQRLRIAGEGVMHGAGVGFELFDELKVGQTDFVQRINYQRALQGELSRTISEFPQVDKVRIHLVLPHKTLFIEEQRPASASVVLTLKQGERLDNKQLLGIVNLVALSVEGLTPDHVTVTDTNGQVLYQPSGDSTMEGMTTSQLEYKTTYEANLENRIQQLLTPVVGPGRAMVKVNADLDFNQKTVRKESYDPNTTVVRSEQRSEDSTSGSAMVEDAAISTPQGGAAVPNTNFRGDGFSGTESTQKSSRENRTTNYEINKEEQNIVTAMGGLNRQSIAVIVDGTYTKAEGSDVPVFTPRKAEELERIRALVAKAAGLNPGRGDEIEVSSFEFGSPDLTDEPSLMETMLEYAQRLGKPFLNGLLVFLFLVLVVRPVVMALIRPRVSEEGIETLERLPEGEARMALGEPEAEEMGMLEESKRFELAKTLALQLFEENVEQSVTVLKTWLKQEA
ncbi:flagellar basal-body MS-ring/collar protein FliF [Desulfolutivibrio sulfoxidireducens]|uniref:flagellar basal-body MS-ring/collar protein FliF n=1 Tax=Desulfolutivibrio sulfoxidireducens TaxID=2773299 RepID=UPI00159EAEF0|nr:flagellar basal-body MS-ring/collar protein FliF [Desulfolutivibrio sulfoxidireducens]QLA17505.1 flagellar M-ring protein FliF [Desulfolutivibrio sulfoxidireducens]QLA21090.1 flagellar M-ring protein FliF [Desulfolutivibrio sulfoxidireducens]